MRGIKRRIYELLTIHGHDAVLMLRNEVTGEVILVPGRNIITNEGDKWYAQQACGETPTKSFANLYLATSGPATPAKTDDYDDFGGVTGEKAKSAGYPKTNDDDGDNTGSGVDIVSWKFEYTTSDGPYSAITHSFIAEASAGAGAAILNSYKWGSSWSKDSSTSAKIFANHEMSGS